MKKPSIMKWCYTPSDLPLLAPPLEDTCQTDPDCPPDRDICLEGSCVQCREDSHCSEGYSCFNNNCFYPSGKVLVSSILVQGSCSGCPDLAVTVRLAGERTVQHKEGITCTSATTSLGERTVFNNNQTLNTCYKVKIKLLCQHVNC